MTAFSLLYRSNYNAPTNDHDPFGLTVTKAASTASLAWQAQQDAYAYDVHGGPADEPLQLLISNQSGVSASLNGLVSGAIYAFVVVAKLGDRKTLVSDLVRITA